jgi:N-acetylglucosamine-6-phosphate deacetylase
MTYRGISVEDGRALEVRVSGAAVDQIKEIEDPGSLPYLSPGLFDIQVNGYAGVDYGYDELSGEDVERTVYALAASGTTHHHATIITNPPEVIEERLKIFRRAAEDPVVGEALAGVHLEGPFISPEDGPRGAHDPRFVQPPDFGLFTQWYETSGGMIRMITVAPEVEGAIEFIEKVSALGVVCAIGHTAADGQTISRAVDAGARLSTHLGNGSHASLPRLDNYIWEQAAEDRLWASLICDGYHLTPAAVKVIARAKGLERLILIGDSTSLTGKPPGVYQWGDTKTEIADDGHITLSGTPYLAGAGFLLDWDIPRFMEYTGSSLRDALRLCTDNPRALFGHVASGKNGQGAAPASFILFRYSPGDERLRVEKTVIAGREIYTSRA